MRLLRWLVATPTRKVTVSVAAVLLIPLGALAWYLGSPLFIDEVVDEPFPLSAGAVLPADVTQQEAEDIMAEEAKQSVVVDEPMPKPDPPEATPDSGPIDVPTPTTPQDPAPTATAPPVPAPTATIPPAESQPVAIKTGEFRDADNFHRGSGSATVYQLSDGSFVLRLEDLEVTNGPELHVLLSANPNPDSRAQVMNEGYVDLGDLKGNVGNQNYEIAADVDVSAYSSVVIYCKPFHVVFSVASLEG